MKRIPQVFLRHILDSIEAIEEYTEDYSEEEFLDLREKQDAVIRRVEIIGEAVRNIPADFREQHLEIPWKKIAGMRDKLVHEYFGVDLELVWEVVQNDLPPFKKQVEELLKR